MKKPGYTFCLSCEYPLAHIYDEPKYNGLRGHCPRCGGNWAES